MIIDFFQKKTKVVLFIICVGVSNIGLSQGLSIAKLKYSGGGDWYANKTALPNLIEFCNRELNMNLNPSDMQLLLL